MDSHFPNGSRQRSESVHAKGGYVSARLGIVLENDKLQKLVSDTRGGRIARQVFLFVWIATQIEPLLAVGAA